MVDSKYLALIHKIMTKGSVQKDRTDVGKSKQLFSGSIKFDTRGKYVPFIQCRTFSPKLSWEEFQWMLSGSTDSTILEDLGVNIWKGNTSREFLDSRNLHHLPAGSVGKSYGHQFRNFGGVDQVEKVFESLRSDPTSRRHIISIWNVPELKDAPLEPCSFLYEFMVEGNELHLHQHMRSADMVFGVPYNMAFGSFLLFTFAKALGYNPGKYWITMTNCHIYENQYEIATTMLENLKNGEYDTLDSEPKLRILKEVSSLDDILKLSFSDLSISGWNRGPKIGIAKMAT